MFSGFRDVFLGPSGNSQRHLWHLAKDVLRRVVGYLLQPQDERRFGGRDGVPRQTESIVRHTPVLAKGEEDAFRFKCWQLLFLSCFVLLEFCGPFRLSVSRLKYFLPYNRTTTTIATRLNSLDPSFSFPVSRFYEEEEEKRLLGCSTAFNSLILPTYFISMPLDPATRPQPELSFHFFSPMLVAREEQEQKKDSLDAEDEVWGNSKVTVYPRKQ